MARQSSDNAPGAKILPHAVAMLVGPALVALLLAVRVSTAHASDYYVDAIQGSDSNNGRSPQTAFRSLAAVRRLRPAPGDRVLLARGRVWRDSLEIDPPWIGTSAAPITLGTYGSGPPPEITGADLFTSLSPACDGRCFSAPAPRPVRRVFVDHDGFVGDQRVENPARLTAGSWTWANGRLFVRLPHDSSPAGHRIEATVRRWGVRCWGCRNVTIEGIGFWGYWDDGINFDGAPQSPEMTSSLIVRNCIVHDIGQGGWDETGVQVGSTYARDVIIEANAIYRIGLGQGFGARAGAGGIGILFNHCDHCTARGNDVHDAGHIGIAAQLTDDSDNAVPEPDDVSIVGNRVHDCPGVIPGLDRADGVYLRRASNARITDNRIWNIASPEAGAGDGVHVGPGSGNVMIARNIIGSCFGAVYVDDAQHGPVDVTRNTFAAVGRFFARVPQTSQFSVVFNRNSYGRAAPRLPFVVSFGTSSFDRTDDLSLAQWRALGHDTDSVFASDAVR